MVDGIERDGGRVDLVVKSRLRSDKVFDLSRGVGGTAKGPGPDGRLATLPNLVVTSMD